MNTIIKKTNTSSSAADSDVSSPQLSFPMDCSPFLNWNEEKLPSEDAKAIVFRSLVATVKLQPALDDSLEAKAIEFLESSDLVEGESADMFLDSLRRPTDGSLSDFIQSIVVLLSSTNEAIPITAMEMLNNLLANCSTQSTFFLIEADIIPQLINTINPLSLSFSEAEDIHTGLITSIAESLFTEESSKFPELCNLSIATPLSYGQLEIEDCDEQQAVHETVLKHVLAPSEQYICHLCVNRFSILDDFQSKYFLVLLTQLLDVSPYHQPTMELVLDLPVLLTIPSCLTFFESDHSIGSFLTFMVKTLQEWNETSGTQRQMWMKVYRMLRKEGIEDVIEGKLENDRNTTSGGLIVTYSIDLNNLQGMNLPRPE
ncbi:hypothetical protein BLNAU_7106 [Blattamonas nauphoetae]|uniref:DNA mismatch repair protein HSM3 N-terminal domain-containing protein n=1 Tax=Blattamonas nauphoetae TaxID=2049346 RepID=A0ABQ9Y2F4_9EUKA|nr:hypothetical protein BLNAU_7106 [Blattamonas nauphoetae]